MPLTALINLNFNRHFKVCCDVRFHTCVDFSNNENMIMKQIAFEYATPNERILKTRVATALEQINMMNVKMVSFRGQEPKNFTLPFEVYPHIATTFTHF
jgi:hypothetical protein